MNSDSILFLHRKDWSLIKNSSFFPLPPHVVLFCFFAIAFYFPGNQIQDKHMILAAEQHFNNLKCLFLFREQQQQQKTPSCFNCFLCCNI